MAYSITIKYGNVLSAEADFIVNASNTKLLLGSGVSLAFKKHCGIKLQKEMNDTIKNINGFLQQGDVVLTSSAGAKNFTYCLHAVIIDYNIDTRQNNKKLSLNTVLKALKNIESYLFLFTKKCIKKQKIALPLLGCGVGGLKKAKVLRLYKDYFEREVDIECDVFIYILN